VTRQELYETIDDILELPVGTIRGGELLAEIKTWDSLAVVSFIATVNGLFGVVLSPPRVRECTSVQDLVALVADHLTDGAA
jgi:acyl carrier protein